MAEAEEDKCKCPGCNCFAGLVHVKAEGTWVVVNGHVYPLREWILHGDNG